MKIAGKLSKREQQIMDLAYERGEIAATDLEVALGGLSNSAVRSYLRTLETKGFLMHIEEGVRFVYRPVHDRDAVGKGETSRLLRTFFGGSVSGMLATLLSEREADLSDADFDEMRRMIEQAREEGGGL
ncbi:BlaI/MecI/CopY family transcriptional regulator [soil metagenome]